MKRRIIITIDNDSITDEKAVESVLQVVSSGKSSKYKDIKQYCFVTIFKDGLKVYARDKKNINTDSFVVW
jgi:hypothetical protein